MKKSGVLHHRLAEIIAGMGHGDLLVIGDAGLPIPLTVERIDLAVTAGMPPMLAVTKAVSAELHVERIIIASELAERDPEHARQISQLFPAAPVDQLPHEEFKATTHRARAIVRTGECTPYANVILVSGVTF